MFDTKIYHPFGCGCLGCYKVDYCCNYYLGRTYFKTENQQIIEKNIYNKGFYDGLKESEERNRFRPKDMEGQEIIEKLKTAIKPLEELKKDLGII